MVLDYEDDKCICGSSVAVQRYSGRDAGYGLKCLRAWWDFGASEERTDAGEQTDRRLTPVPRPNISA